MNDLHALADRHGFDSPDAMITSLLDSINFLHDKVRQFDAPCVLKFARRHHLALLPRRSEPGSAGFDLYLPFDVTLRAGDLAIVDTGLDLIDAVPGSGWYAQVFGRGGLGGRGLLATLAGVIDLSYRGPLLLALANVGDDPIEVRYGKAVAQLVPLRQPSLVDVVEGTQNDRTTTERGSRGGIVQAYGDQAMRRVLEANRLPYLRREDIDVVNDEIRSSIERTFARTKGD